MSEDKQKELQDALELDRYIEQLRLRRSARLPANTTPQQLRIYSMALLFHTASPQTASPDAASPRPEFGAQLYQQLLQQRQAEANRQADVDIGQAPTTILAALPQREERFRRIYKHNQGSQPAQLPSARPNSTPVEKNQTQDVRKRQAFLRRRTLLTGGTIAASLLAGAGIGAGLEYTLKQEAAPPPTLPGNTWYSVTSVNELGQGPIAFTTETITGYVIRQTENAVGEQIVAFSGACPHLGCLVQWQNTKREFLCPCHERAFDTAGGPVERQPQYTPLPRLETKIEDGNIYVKIP